MAGKKPEHQAPPEIFYNEEEAAKYTSNTRIMQIQSEMSERALELLALPEDQSCLLLDIGCGSGLSGDCCEELGHTWVGLDISQAMLDIARERESEAGDVICADMGQGLCFRAGSFDGAISISALQWLCNADKSWHNPHKRLASPSTIRLTTRSDSPPAGCINSSPPCTPVSAEGAGLCSSSTLRTRSRWR